MRASVRRFAPPLVYLAASIAIVIAAGGAIAGLTAERGEAALTPLVLAGGCLALQVCCLAAAWRMILGRSSPAVTPRAGVLRGFLLGWLSRYLPGPPTGLAGKYLISRQAGYGRVAIAGALVYENALLLAASATIPLLTVGFVFGRGWAVVALVCLGLGAVGAAVVLRPGAIRRVAGRRLTRGADLQLLSLGALLGPGSLMIVAAGLAGLCFHIVVVALTDLPAETVGRSLFVFSAAALAGFVTPFVPSGAGVREAIIVTLMAPLVGHSDALSVAVVARAISVLLDLGIAAAVAGYFAWDWLQRLGEGAQNPSKYRA
ncbi:MAG: hypothetical protein ACKVVT_09450 [Dehalococcoidia bacterium]